jgi:glutaminase
MNTIYLVTFGTYLEDVLEGFATNEEEIRQIVVNAQVSNYYKVETRKLDIEINLQEGTVVVKGEWNTTYSIHTLKRVSG